MADSVANGAGCTAGESARRLLTAQWQQAGRRVAFAARVPYHRWVARPKRPGCL